jgi:TolB-like protein
VFSESGFDVVERNSINKIMKEWKLKTSGVTDDQFEGIGELLTADYLITGTVDDDGKNSGIYCVIKMIDVQSGKLMEAASIEGQIKTKRELYDIGVESIIEQLVYGTNQKMKNYQIAALVDSTNKAIRELNQKQETMRLESQLKKKEMKEKRKRQLFRGLYDFTMGIIYAFIRFIELLILIEEEDDDSSNYSIIIIKDRALSESMRLNKGICYEFV